MTPLMKRIVKRLEALKGCNCEREVRLKRLLERNVNLMAVNATLVTA